MSNIVIIGPRGSGKTTYLAGLAYWEQLRMANTQKSPFNVEPINEDAIDLADEAERVIVEGKSLHPSKVVEDLPVYNLVVKVKQNFWQEPQSINLAVKDYPGEIFEKIVEGIREGSLEEQLIDECLMIDNQGCLILLTDWENKKAKAITEDEKEEEQEDNYKRIKESKNSADEFYHEVMKIFLKLMQKRGRLSNLRLAMVMSKCERGELWPARLDPETDLFKVHLPKTLKLLHQKIQSQNLQFFAISTFGVLGKNDPRPNRADDDDELEIMGSSVLREPESWCPYGLIPPIYWLGTGKTIKEKI